MVDDYTIRGLLQLSQQFNSSHRQSWKHTTMPQPQTSQLLPTVLGLPTMHDLPSDDPLEPGLPDEFHGLQPQLLADSLNLPDYAPDEIFQAFDLNLYYDDQNTGWYKRPDWFLVVGASRLYQGVSMRSSYVIWDEKIPPVLIVEFLSPGTEAEDLGRFATKPPATAKPGKPPHKFTVYEEILKIPNYVVFDESTQRIRYFRLINGRYQEQALAAQNPRLWIPEINLGLGLWPGAFRHAPQLWLRWCDAQGNWLLTEAETERQAKEMERRAKEVAQQAGEAERRAKEAVQQAGEVERQEKERLANYLRSLGLDPDNLPPI
jgi:Uma2 family endonuclease